MTFEQKQLFEVSQTAATLTAPPTAGVARVVFVGGPTEPLDYAIPQRLASHVRAGCRVRVPLGRGSRQALGYCVEVSGEPVTYRVLKPISSVVDALPLVDASLVELSRWLAKEYLCSWGEALQTILPAPVRQQAGLRTTIMLGVPDETLEKLEGLKLPPKQLHALRTLVERGRSMTPAALASAAGCTIAPINSLRRKGLVRAMTHRVRHSTIDDAPVPREGDHSLNADQEQALAAILAACESAEHGTVLLHGITGSGKTEVYIRAIREVHAQGRQAIVLVPEISLTPQTRRRFQSRFDNVAVLHSHLADTERAAYWERIARGEVSVVVGARSAVFAPVPRLGLIVVDEEHEASFKQESAPRYHARDVAQKRAELAGVPLVLGSATPALESWQRAQNGAYAYVTLPRRVLDLPLPDVRIVDMRTQGERPGQAGPLSRPLRQAMEQALDEGGQVILLLNRRGYSTHIQCPSCGYVVRCPQCDLALTFHRHFESAMCHYCDYQEPAPRKCPECELQGIRYSGIGTERLESLVRLQFPDRTVLRMDTDSMQKRGSHERALDRFRAREVDILLGTQMIAKGLDFPNVTLVGVVNADTALHLPDFRAAEKTFQLLVQVAGRSGRGPQGGRVLVQTFSPDHSAIRATQQHDYATFARRELPLREQLGYPPFGRMIRVVVRGPSEPVSRAAAGELGARLREDLVAAGVSARVLGPAPAPIAKLRGLYRFQLQLQSPDLAQLRAGLAAALAACPVPPEIQRMVDVDPCDML